MEYKFSQDEAADMCQRIISVIIGKYIDDALEAKNDRIELSVIRPHAKGSAKKIVVEVSKDADTSVKVTPLRAEQHDGGGLWTFLEKYLPDYYHRDDILHHDIYSRYVDNEELSDGDLQWIYADFGSDKSKVKEALKEMEMGFAYEALLSWLEDHGPESW